MRKLLNYSISALVLGMAIIVAGRLMDKNSFLNNGYSFWGIGIMVLGLVGALSSLFLGKPGSLSAIQHSRTSEYKLGTKWLSFYIYFRIPAGIILQAIICMAILYVSYDESMAVQILAISIANIAISILLFTGLHMRKEWGWWLNWAALLSDVFLRPTEKSDDVYGYISLSALAAVFWFIPNAIYFTKRKHLFTSGIGRGNSCSVNKTEVAGYKMKNLFKLSVFIMLCGGALYVAGITTAFDSSSNPSGYMVWPGFSLFFIGIVMAAISLIFRK